MATPKDTSTVHSLHLRPREPLRRGDRKIVRVKDREVCRGIVSIRNDGEATLTRDTTSLWLPKQGRSIENNNRQLKWKRKPREAQELMAERGIRPPQGHIP